MLKSTSKEGLELYGEDEKKHFEGGVRFHDDFV